MLLALRKCRDAGGIADSLPPVMFKFMRPCQVEHFLNSLIAYIGQPKFDWFGFLVWYMYQTQQVLLWQIGNQLLTIVSTYNQLAAWKSVYWVNT